MPDNKVMDAFTALQFADKSDPVIAALCLHLGEVIDQLAEQRTINLLIEEQLAKLGIELGIQIKK